MQEKVFDIVLCGGCKYRRDRTCMCPKHANVLIPSLEHFCRDGVLDRDAADAWRAKGVLQEQGGEGS